MKNTAEITGEEMNKFNIRQKQYERLSKWVEQLQNISLTSQGLDADSFWNNHKIGEDIYILMDEKDEEGMHISEVINVIISNVERKMDIISGEMHKIVKKSTLKYKSSKK